MNHTSAAAHSPHTCCTCTQTNTSLLTTCLLCTCANDSISHPPLFFSCTFGAGTICHPPTAASALRKLGRSEEATAALLQAAAAANGGPCDAGLHAQVQYKLGQHYRSIGKPGSFALAAQAYSRCLELEPGHALAAFWLSATKKLAAAGDAQGTQ